SRSAATARSRPRRSSPPTALWRPWGSTRSPWCGSSTPSRVNWTSSSSWTATCGCATSTRSPGTSAVCWPRRRAGEPVDTELTESAATRELTAAVLRIWCEVLGVDTVAPLTSIFELGGHSLLAAGIIALVRAELRVDLPFGGFFDDPTVAGTAALVARCRAGDGPAAGTGAETGAEITAAALDPPPDAARAAALC